MPPEPDIRTATLDDAPEIARLLSPLGDPLTAEDLVAVWQAWKAEGNFALVVEGEGALLGVITLHRMVVLHRPRPVGRITSLAVDPIARGRGLGRALVRAGEEALARVGCGLLELTSHRRRRSAHAFYRYLGFQETSLRFARTIERDGP